MSDQYTAPDSDLPVIGTHPLSLNNSPPDSTRPADHEGHLERNSEIHAGEHAGEHAVQGRKDTSRGEKERGEKERGEKERGDKGRGGSFFMWTMSMLLVLMVFQFLAPYLAEEIQYALTRGKQRAQHEAAKKGLGELSLDKLSLASQMISQRVGPSVVHINTTGWDVENTRLMQNREVAGQGSGIVVDKEGFVVTNQHVIDGAKEIEVRLSDGRVVEASIVGIDPLTDIAVLKIKAGGLMAADWGSSEEVDVGALVWAVGSPFGLQRSITFGILSAKNRAGMAGKPLQDFLQTDAAVNPGNSGGPLVNSRGEVIGINTAIVGEAYQGISFSVPSSVAKKVYEELRSGTRVTRGWLGVELDQVTRDHASKNGQDRPFGAVIRRIVSVGNNISPAHRAGIEEGDIVVQWGDKKTNSPAILTQEVANTKIGSSVDVIVIRDGKRLQLTVAVGKRPSQYN